VGSLIFFVSANSQRTRKIFIYFVDQWGALALVFPLSGPRNNDPARQSAGMPLNAVNTTAIHNTT
jgi:hypothetical protein